MKIAIMTWFHIDNYGTVLQAAALSHVLRQKGHEVDVIRYFPKEQVNTMPDRSMRKALVRRIREQQRERRNPGTVSRLAGEDFQAFRDRYLNLTDYYSTMTDLESLNDTYDAFICGSDLIWLPRYFDSHFYLDFVHDTECMIAYAPSLLDDGQNDARVLEEMGNLIRRFKHLSVRESDGRRMLSSEFEIHTEEVADPVLMLTSDEWEAFLEMGNTKAITAAETEEAKAIEKDEKETPEIETEQAIDGEMQTAASQGEGSPTEESEGTMLVCFQGDHFLYWEAVDKLAARLNLRMQVIPIHENDLRREGCIEEPVSPTQFVERIKEASYVCTDSYHATALSILYKKEFCCFERYTERGEQGRNSRIHHILDVVGLSQRIYESEKPLENYLAQIDWIPVNYKLDALRLKSHRYLDDALDAVRTHIEAKEGQSPKSHVLDTYSLCTGCGACEAVCAEHAVKVTLSDAGFLEAKVEEEKCTSCSRCLEVCPMREAIYGKRIAAGRLLSYLDEEMDMRQSAAAGGLSGRLAKILHERGYAIAGCVYDDEQQMARHVLIRPEDESELLEHLKGNKYLQSDLKDLWQELAAYEGPLALFAAPCQIAALKKALYGRENTYYIDCVCSGVPSVHLYRKYLKSMKKRKGPFYWLLPRADSFERMRQLDECSMRSCYECRWRDISAADLRIGDMRTEFAGHRGSVDGNLVIDMNDAGEQLINLLMTSGYWEGLKKEDIVAYITTCPPQNPIKPIFYDELMSRLADEKISMRRLVNEYVHPFEKRYSWDVHETMFYEVSGDGDEKKRLLDHSRAEGLAGRTLIVERPEDEAEPESIEEKAEEPQMEDADSQKVPAEEIQTDETYTIKE